MGRLKSSVIMVTLVLVGVAALLAVLLAGIHSTYQTTSDLEHSAARNECARQISADLDENFRHDIAGLLDAATRRDPHGLRQVLDRMKAAPNAADEINRRCPAPITKGH